MFYHNPSANEKKKSNLYTCMHTSREGVKQNNNNNSHNNNNKQTNKKTAKKQNT